MRIDATPPLGFARILPMRTLVIAFAVAALAGGCSSTRWARSSVATEVAHRSTLPSCGQEVTTQDSGFDLEGRRCFWDAYLAGRPAEFISTRPSVEGDPITTIYRVLAPGHAEVFTDATKDRFGSGGWEKRTCRTLRLVKGGPVEPDFGPDETCVESTTH